MRGEAGGAGSLPARMDETTAGKAHMPFATMPSARHVARWSILLLLVLLPALLVQTQPARAVKVLALVNDLPITDLDVSRRMKLHRILGMRFRSTAQARKRALQALIDDAVLEAEARRLGMALEETQVEAAVRRMASGMGGMDKLRAVLRRNGLDMNFLRSYVRGQMIFRTLLARSGRKIDARVDDAAVNGRLHKILSDPRLKPITIWRIRQVTLPVDDVAPVMRQQLLLARAVEARQIMRRYRGCGSLRSAASGIFNVRISRVIEADPRRMPKPLRAALRKAGTRHLVGPVRAPRGIQLLALCGTRAIRPKLPDKGKLRQRIRAALQQEKIGRQVEQFMKTLRRKAIIDWRTKRS